MADLESKDTLYMYTLWYRSGDNPGAMTKNFNLPYNDMRTVIQRTKDHCDLMGYRFVRVKPFLSDLIKDEEMKGRGE
jgi:hypothetical protein